MLRLVAIISSLEGLEMSPGWRQRTNVPFTCEIAGDSRHGACIVLAKSIANGIPRRFHIARLACECWRHNMMGSLCF